MLQFIIVNLTALALLGHALAGCCWHHGHAGRSLDEQPPAVKPVVCVCHGHQHGEEGADSHHHDRDGHGGCGEAKCSLVARDVRLQLASPLDALALAPSNVPTLQGSQGSLLLGPGLIQRLSPSGPGLARHLLLGVIVV